MAPYNTRTLRSSEVTLKQACIRIADAANTKNTLHLEAYRIGRLIIGGLLDYYTGHSELLIAGVMGGLTQSEIRPVLRDAFDQAKRNPVRRHLQLIEVVA